MDTPLLDWQAPHLQARLQGLLRDAQNRGQGTRFDGVAVRAVAQTGSTNTDLLELARTDAASTRSVQVLLAQSQHAGRGRLGRRWHAEPGASLTFSLGLALQPQPGWGALSLVVGHALAQALQPWDNQGPPAGAPGRLMLKWPNDLWWVDGPTPGPDPAVTGRKLAGILMETVPMSAVADGCRWVVVGIGLNIRAAALDPEGLPPQGVACTAEWRPHDSAPAIWHAVVPPVLEALLAFESQGFDAWRPAVEQRELLRGQTVTLSAGPITTGLCLGLDSDGALRVQGPDGPVRVVAGEVQVRPRPPALT